MPTNSLINSLIQIENNPNFRSDVISDYYKCLRNQITITKNDTLDSKAYNKLLSERCVEERSLFNKYGKCDQTNSTSENYEKCQDIGNFQKIADYIDSNAYTLVDREPYLDLHILSGILSDSEL